MERVPGTRSTLKRIAKLGIKKAPNWESDFKFLRYADALDASVYHFRDKEGLECDAVIHLRNGSYGLIEIKLGGDKLIEEGATSLKKLSGLIDTEKMKTPSFLMVITANGNVAYRRPDGVMVVPLGGRSNRKNRKNKYIPGIQEALSTKYE